MNKHKIITCIIMGQWKIVVIEYKGDLKKYTINYNFKGE